MVIQWVSWLNGNLNDGFHSLTPTHALWHTDPLFDVLSCIFGVWYLDARQKIKSHGSWETLSFPGTQRNPSWQNLWKCYPPSPLWDLNNWRKLDSLRVSLVSFIFNISIRLERFNLNSTIHDIFASEFSTLLYKQILITLLCISVSGMISHGLPFFTSFLSSQSLSYLCNWVSFR